MGVCGAMAVEEIDWLSWEEVMEKDELRRCPRQEEIAMEKDVQLGMEVFPSKEM